MEIINALRKMEPEYRVWSCYRCEVKDYYEFILNFLEWNIPQICIRKTHRSCQNKIFIILIIVYF